MRRMAFSYGCVMARLPPLLAEEIRGYGESIPAQYRKSSSWDETNNGVPILIHVTVKYGLLTEDANEVAAVLAGAEPVVVRLGLAGIFHNPDEAVLKIACESTGLRELHNRLCAGLGHVNTYRDFRPHVTVAYMVKREDDPYYYRTFFSDEFEGREFEVEQVVFATASGDKSVISFDGMVIPMALESAARAAYTRR